MATSRGRTGGSAAAAARRQGEALLAMWRGMVRIRVCEESFVEPIIRGEVRTPCHLYSGQEAVAVGVCRHLRHSDMVFGSHRSHGHYLAKGGSMAEIVAEIYGKVSGCARGRGGSMHVIAPEVGMLGAAPIVGGTIPLALGAALASARRGTGDIAVSFFGDGATGEGVLYESLNFAVLRKLPMLFVCENNFYSTHLPFRECRARDNLYEIGTSFGAFSARVDGNDVVKVAAAARRAIRLCRTGNGPSFLECQTYRRRGHVGPDDNIQGSREDIRPKAEIEAWTRRDPIDRLERRMLKRGLVDLARLRRARRRIEAEVANAHAFARSSESPAPQSLLHHVYASENASV